MLNIAVVGHSRTMETIIESIKNHFKDIETVRIEFLDMDMKNATVEYLKSQIDSIDGIVFTGRAPRDILNGEMALTIPQVYIRYDSSILLQALTEATVLNNYDIKRISCDTYSKKDIENTYAGFGININQIDVSVAPKNSLRRDDISELWDFHKDKYINSNVSFCITGVAKVFEQLRQAKIPALLLRPTTESVINSIRELLNKIKAINSTESQIVIISLEIDLPNEYNLIHENVYQLMLEKTRVTEEVYRFAETIQAAVVEVGIHNYLLFSTRKIFEAATSHFMSLSILSGVSTNSLHTLSIGVGYGKTAREAKYNASIGLNRALSKGGNQAFIVENGVFSNPVYPDQEEHVLLGTISDPLFTIISSKTGISINNIYRLHCIKEKTKKDCFTSSELAKEFGNTRRSINRIIEKLENAGYAQIEGTRMMSDTGRPTRIIRLIF